MPYTPDATNTAQPADTGVLAATAAAEFRAIKTYMSAVLLAAITAKYTPGGALGTPISGNLANCTGFPTLNQNTTGTAAAWTTARLLANNSVNGSANVAFANAFIVKGTADTGLSGAQFLGALATGIVKNTTTTGNLTIAAAGTDYVAPGGALGTPSSGTLTNCTGLPLVGLLGHTSWFDNGNSGTTKTIVVASGGLNQKLTLNGNCNLTLDWTGAPMGHYMFAWIQDGTGSRSLTYTAGLTATLWLGSVAAPAISTTLNTTTVVSAFYSGSGTAPLFQSSSKAGS